jgi:hypothetical protein
LIYYICYEYNRNGYMRKIRVNHGKRSGYTIRANGEN